MLKSAPNPLSIEAMDSEHSPVHVKVLKNSPPMLVHSKLATWQDFLIIVVVQVFEKKPKRGLCEDLKVLLCG